MFCFNYSSYQRDKERLANSKRSLSFESKFECGNLRKAIQVSACFNYISEQSSEI